MAVLSDSVVNGNLSVTKSIDINGVKVATMSDLNTIRQKIAGIADGSITTLTAEDLSGALWIKAYVFRMSANLSAVELPSTVGYIGQSAFDGCSSLTKITIPNSVTTFGVAAFRDCTSLINITYTGTISQWNSIAKSSNWNGNTGNYTIHCTDGDIPKS